jgi:zinc finger SWIM domain-containing protein 3
MLFGDIVNKRFLCSKNGFKEETNDASNKRKSQVDTRCGCDAHIYVKLGTDKKYYIYSMFEQHNHILCSPNKAPFLQSNRSVSQTAKNTLFTCHKASVGTSQSYRILQCKTGWKI